MRNLIALVIVALLGWQGYKHFSAQPAPPAALVEQPAPVSPNIPAAAPAPAATRSFKCDGRIYCSQMTSCEEATYFLRSCPGVKMDGNNDGVPCEQQWCKR